jgi:hypothetical protein
VDRRQRQMCIRDSIIPGSPIAIGRTTTKLYYLLTDSISKTETESLRLVKVYSVMLPLKSYIKKDGNKKGLLDDLRHFTSIDIWIKLAVI